MTIRSGHAPVPGRPSPFQASATPGTVAVVVATVGVLAATAVAWTSGTAGTDIAVLVGLAALASVGAAVVGGFALHHVRCRPVRTQVLIVALTSLLAGLAGVAVGSAAMVPSTHDLGALAVVLLASGGVSVGAAVQLGGKMDAGPPWVAGPSASPEELAVLVGRLTDLDRRLQRSQARERALEASRRELVAWMSHDLRSPIATIRAMAEALDDEVADDPATVRRYHRQIRSDAERLGVLVDDLFELSRIRSGALRLDHRPALLGEVVSEAVEAAAAAARRKNVELVERVDDPACLALGARELLRVLANLLENAIRHTPSGGAVVVEAGPPGGDCAAGVVLSVLDGCGGIADADLPRVFEVAFRGDAARSHDQRGGGLGLPIAQGLVEAHGGAITVANETGGCRFTVHLPGGGLALPEPAVVRLPLGSVTR